MYLQNGTKIIYIAQKWRQGRKLTPKSGARERSANRRFEVLSPLGANLAPEALQDRPGVPFGPFFGRFWTDLGRFWVAFGKLVVRFWEACLDSQLPDGSPATVPRVDGFRG